MRKFLTLFLALILAILPVALADDTAADDTQADAEASGGTSAIHDAGALPSVSITTGLMNGSANHTMVVQLDNTPEARPQYGISMADIVYEAEIQDAGMTRYTAVFNDTIPELVEGVRSARILHADIYLEYGGYFVHAGGQSIEGTNVFAYFKQMNITQRYDALGGAFAHRDHKRDAPYNLYVDLLALYESIDWTDVVCTSPLSFSETPTLGDEKVTQLTITYRKNNYIPSYQYSEEEGIYYRYYCGEPMVDGLTGEQVTCSNIIILHTDWKWQGGWGNRPVMRSTGTGRCDFFIGGTHFTGTWVRDAVTESTTFYDEEGNEVMFQPGKTFIQVMRPYLEPGISYSE